MTVNTTIRKRIFNGDNSTTVFPWNFKLTEESQMHVYVDGVERAQGDATYPWSISGVLGESGNVTFTLAPPPVGTSNVLLVREMTFDQQVDYQPLDAFPADTHEEALDKLTMITQENQEEIARAFKSAITDESGADYTLPAPVANSVAAMWNGTADALVIGPTATEIANAQTYATNAAASASAASDDADAAAASLAQMNGFETITYGATKVFDFDAAQTKFCSMTGDFTTLTTANGGAGKSFTLILFASGANRNITYNVNWQQMGALPTVIPSGKYLLLSFIAIGTLASEILVAGGLEA